MPDLLPITLDDMLACVERELALRRRVYPRQVADKRMTQDFADRQIAVMEEVAKALRKLGAF